MTKRQELIASLIQERQLAEKHAVGVSLAVASLKGTGSFRDELASEKLLLDAAESRRLVDVIDRVIARVERGPNTPQWSFK